MTNAILMLCCLAFGVVLSSLYILFPVAMSCAVIAGCAAFGWLLRAQPNRPDDLS